MGRQALKVAQAELDPATEGMVFLDRQAQMEPLARAVNQLRHCLLERRQSSASLPLIIAGKPGGTAETEVMGVSEGLVRPENRPKPGCSTAHQARDGEVTGVVAATQAPEETAARVVLLAE